MILPSTVKQEGELTLEPKKQGSPSGLLLSIIDGENCRVEVEVYQLYMEITQLLKSKLTFPLAL